MEEYFKDIKGFEGLYQISNLGKVKSFYTNTILKSVPSTSGYYIVCLRKNKKNFTRRIHHLVWDNFGNQKRNGLKLQIDHIDHNKANNAINNLQLLSGRANTVKYFQTQKTSSKFTGVSFNKRCKKWEMKISVGNTRVGHGLFSTELEASKAYNDKLKEVEANRECR